MIVKYMSAGRYTLLLLAILLAGCGLTDATGDDPAIEPKSVEKTNPMQVYMHYMPWYQGKEVSGYWGSHWRMGNRNPDRVGEDGQREIASHYYPLIGPYDSKDEAVIEYHLLLMKYAGVDGVLIDWYGTHNVHDYKLNLTSSNALIDRMGEVGMQYGIVYEEYAAGNVGERTGKTAIQAAQEDVAYMQTHYFGENEYLQVDGQPLLMTFGPRYFRQESQWNRILEPLEEEVTFLPLWGHDHLVGDAADGEYSWVDFTASLEELGGFYDRQAILDVLVGSAYPRFHDYYEEGDWGESYGYVPSSDGETLRRTLELAREHSLEHLQLATWNDFGEGTVIEPTAEDGFLFLEIIQEFTGVPYGRAELELVYDYYILKKEYRGDPDKEDALQRAFDLLTALRVEEAREVLSGLS